jgi:hypothetical protein
MQGFIKVWSLRFLWYAVLLVTSLGAQVALPDLFAMFCTPSPFVEFLNQAEGLALPLNTPVLKPNEGELSE